MSRFGKLFDTLTMGAKVTRTHLEVLVGKARPSASGLLAHLVDALDNVIGVIVLDA
jgi:hypothetical protein